MSLECSECEHDLCGGHDKSCSRHPDNRKAKKGRRRRLICCDTFTEGTGDAQTFTSRPSLPMSSANAMESENSAVRIMYAVNAQLDFAGSDLRLVVYDVKQKKYVKVEIPGV